MEPLGNDRWAGRFPLEENTRYVYTLEALPDAYRTWAEDLRKRLAAGMDVTSELLEGAALLRGALARVVGADRRRLEARLADFERRRHRPPESRLLLDEEIAGAPRHLPRPERRRRDTTGSSRWWWTGPGPLRRLVRVVPAIPGPGPGPARHVPRLHRAAARDRRTWAST